RLRQHAGPRSAEAGATLSRAGGAVGDVRARARARLDAGLGGAGVAVVAVDRAVSEPQGQGAGLGGVAPQGGPAGRALRDAGDAAGARAGVARGDVAGVGAGAHDRVGAHAGARDARVGLRASVAVTARRAVRLGRVQAGARGRVARAALVAL